jgi:hypothetical protein
LKEGPGELNEGASKLPLTLSSRKRGGILGQTASLNSDHWLRCKNRLIISQTRRSDEKAKDLSERVQGASSLGGAARE